MRFVPTKIHGYLDYIVGALLIAAPWLFHFARGGAETWIPVIMGIIAFIYSFITDYELGVLPVLSMPVHLIIDFIFGLVLATSPWLFGFADFIYWPHLLFGVFAIIASLITKKTPAVEKRSHPAASIPAP